MIVTSAAPLLMPDISHWQGHHTREDMEMVATKAGAIMLKASEGRTWIDPEFVSNAEAMNAAGALGVPWGAYHFVSPGFGRKQAEHFHKVATSVPGCRFLCIDWEAGSRDTAKALANRLLALASARVGDYIGSHARANGGQLPGMGFHMVPQYGPAHLDPRYATDPLSAWQYTNGQVNGTAWPSSIPGIGPCDVSAVYRPADFGFGEEEMALSDSDVKKIMQWQIRGDGLTVAQALRDANEGRAATEALQPALDALPAAVAAQTQPALEALPAAVAETLRPALEALPAAVVAALPPASTVTAWQVQKAAERAIRAVLGGLDADAA